MHHHSQLLLPTSPPPLPPLTLPSPPPPLTLPPFLGTSTWSHFASFNGMEVYEEQEEYSQPSPKEVAEEISKQFKNCLPHTHGESELHRAAFEGDAVRLQLLLTQIDLEPSKSESINQRNRLGCTPIRLAATGGHLECLTLLISAGASIDIVDVKCQTPLFVAVKNRRLDCAEKLLQSGANPDGDCGNSSTPLYVAFMNGEARFVLLLLKYGANPDKLYHFTRISLIRNVHSPKKISLHWAIEYLTGADEIYQVVKALLIRGCKTEDFWYHSCVDHNQEQLIDLLYNFGVPTGARDFNSRLATELNTDNATIKKLIHLRETPRNLLSACRIAIVSCLPRPRRSLDALSSLPLPSAMISYLKFCDL